MKEKLKTILKKDGFSIIFFILAINHIFLLILGNIDLYTISNIIANILFAIFLFKNKIELLRFPTILLLLVSGYNASINFMYILENAQSYGMYISTCMSIFYILNVFGYISFLSMLTYSTLSRYNDRKIFLTKGWYLCTIFWCISNFCNFLVEFNILNFIIYMITPIIYHLLLYKFIVGKRKPKKIDIKKLTVKFYKTLITLFIIAFIIIFIWVMVEGNEFTIEEQSSIQHKIDCKKQSTTYIKCKWSNLENSCICKFR